MRFRQLSIVLATCLVLSGCASNRLAQFRSFSQAGAAYVKASDVFLDQAGVAAVRGDSALLLKSRADLDEEQRRTAILTKNELLGKRLVILRQIKAHGRLLRDYFDVIGEMADSKAPESLGIAAKGVYESLAKLSPVLKSATIGGSSVSGAIPPVVSMVVGSLKVNALEKELQERSALIERELALQEAALSVLAHELQTDLEIELNVQNARDVIGPYVSGSDVPQGWSAKRVEVLSAVVASQTAGAASQAANRLRLSFQKLVANQLGNDSLSSLIGDINVILDLAEQINGTRRQ